MDHLGRSRGHWSTHLSNMATWHAGKSTIYLYVYVHDFPIETMYTAKKEAMCMWDTLNVHFSLDKVTNHYSHFRDDYEFLETSWATLGS